MSQPNAKVLQFPRMEPKRTLTIQARVATPVRAEPLPYSLCQGCGCRVMSSSPSLCLSCAVEDGE